MIIGGHSHKDTFSEPERMSSPEAEIWSWASQGYEKYISVIRKFMALGYSRQEERGSERVYVFVSALSHSFTLSLFISDIFSLKF